MALLDLSLVTKTLIEVVKRAISISPAKPATAPAVTALPPDAVLDMDNAIGIYLYHFVEEAAQKNAVWRGRPDQPQMFSPLGLNLHYVICAHSKSEGNEAAYREQLLMGLAAKALHDYPIVTDETKVAGVTVMPATMLGDENKIRIALRHIPANEAVSYWTAGAHALRLCSYYEVSVVMLEPEEPATAGGRVLTYGIDTFIGGLPRLNGSKSTVVFTIPGETSPRALDVQPAQAAIGDSFTLLGSGLGGGSLELYLRGPGVPDPSPATSWGASAFGDEVTAAVQGDVGGVPSVPGTWGASLRMTRTRTLANGTTHTDVVMSNETPIQVVPAVTVGAPASDGTFTVTGGIFSDASIPVVRTSIGGTQLVTGTLGSLNAGEFAVKSSTEIQMRIPAGATSGQWLPVRVVINGSESSPRWVQVP